MFLVAILFTLFALSCLFVAVATYMLYRYEHQSQLEEFFDSPEAATKAIHKAVFSAFKAQFFCFSIYLYGTLLQYRQKHTPQLPKRPDTPIIMVHGLFHNSSAWLLYKRWLARYGLTNTASFYYSSFKSFEEISQELDAYMKQFFSRYPTAKPVLVGHSMGGLLLRNWLSTASQAKQTAGVVTLGAPMHGSKLAIFSALSLGRKLEFNGALIKQIEQQEQTAHPLDIPCHAFFSPLDNMVLPQKSVSTPPEHWHTHKTKPVSHLAMLIDKSIANNVAHTITTFTKK